MVVRLLFIVLCLSFQAFGMESTSIEYIKTSDDIIIPIDKKALEKSGTLQNLLEDLGGGHHQQCPFHFRL